MNTNENVTPFVFPQGEFTIKQLVLSSGKTQPHVYTLVKKAIESQKVKEVRREKHGQGRPSAVYVTV